jgi:hypothetical protein
LVAPVAGKYTRSGLEIRTVRSPTRTSVADAVATVEGYGIKAAVRPRGPVGSLTVG